MKKAARGCPRIQIWSHEGPNQSQNHVSRRSWCHPVGHPGRPVNHGFAHPASRKARVASGLEPRHVLRKQAILFFSSKNTHPGKRHGKLMIFGQILLIFDHKMTKFEPKCSGPGFFVEIRARPKIWCLVSKKRKIVRLVSTRRQVLAGVCQFARG